MNRGTGLSNILSRRSAEVMTAEYFAMAFSSGGNLRGFINTQANPSPPGVTSTMPCR